MENLLNYQESSGGMLMLETQQRAPVSDPAAGEPPSLLLNTGGGRFHPHIPQPYHHALQQHEQHHRRQQPRFPDGINQGDSASRASPSSLNPSHDHAAAACWDGAESDIWKCGYLRKQKHGHKRFFVLRGPSHAGPSRLEYYDSEKKFRNSLRAAAGASSTACPPKRVIYLYQCFTVSKRADAKYKYLIALYTKDEYFAMVAESEQEQAAWYLALSDLMTEGRKPDPDELDDGYGTVTPGAGFKEVWQVHVKPKGLGQTKNLTGVYRLCLSPRSVQLVKLNADTPCVKLQLMNIRRCGHSESFFFMEVGRSASTGPGELWMQVDDAVVAQSMHETILDTMKALKAFAEFRPRSKSQSTGSNPAAFITTRRHHGNLPPSQTGLQRRPWGDGVSGTPPGGKGGACHAYRFRTSSEGEGTMSRPFRSITGSLLQLSSARGGGRYPRAPPAPAPHTRSASLPVAYFPCSSPVSVSGSSGLGSASDPLTRPSSASLCGSPSDGGFVSSDEYGSSPCDLRYLRVRSATPDSLGNTPPIREERHLSDYMAMERRGRAEGVFPSGPAGGNGTPAGQQKTTQTSSLEERAAEAGSAGGRGQLACSSSPRLRCLPLSDPDEGYTPMMPGGSEYMPMQRGGGPPSQPPPQADALGYMVMLPPSHTPPVDQLQMGEYMDMSRSSGGVPSQLSCEASCGSYFSLPRSYKAPLQHSEYMPMSCPAQPVCAAADGSRESPASVCTAADGSSESPASVCAAADGSSESPASVCAAADGSSESPASICAAADGSSESPASVCAAADGSSESPASICAAADGSSESPASVCAEEQQAARPSCLSLGRRRASKASDPPSPGEYINIAFRDQNTPCNLGTEAPPTPPGSSPLQEDYLSLAQGVSPRPSLVAPWNPPRYTCGAACGSAPCGSATCSHAGQMEDYTEMTFGLVGGSRSPMGQHYPTLPPPAPEMEPTVIRAPPPSRRRHSSETFPASVGGATSNGSTPGTASHCLTDSSKRHSSASFDSVWLRTEGVACADDARGSAGQVCQNATGLNYIALDLREPPPSPTPGLPENRAYASIDFSTSDPRATRSTD
ncbi:insulin receptor substrate 2-B-like [Megalops cyprinoides]|uniref:insulin receptor substrate 2-B-like n=1 Tax=Megalops cyprinoides TaxID=118141 RepID=UPI001864B432|nr:insulin receptor substrate 2-B-like [Megalops cyprinoides]